MPKMKTNKAVRKRFKVTKKGKVIASRSLRRHMLADRSSKKKRQARQPLGIHQESKAIKAMLPYNH